MEKRPFKHLNTVGMYSSAWTSYPKKYKFISYQLNMYDNMVIYKRKTMNWMELFGAVGGLMGFISQFAAEFVGYFAAPQFASYIANRLYTWSEPENITKVFRPQLLVDSDEDLENETERSPNLVTAKIKTRRPPRE